MSAASRPPRSTPVSVGLELADDADPQLAAELASLGLQPAAGAEALVLRLRAGRLELAEPASRRSVCCELVAGPARARLLRAGLRKEALARALGLGSGTRTVLDATAGLGGDSALLAWLGTEVTAVERHPVVAALLRDGLRRAAADPRFGALAGRVQVVTAESRAMLAAVEPPDAVLIDPMFPGGRSALGRGELQLLRQLVGEDEDAGELLEAARAVARRRVVVKRPARAEPLGGRAPHLVSRGASTRFDIYLSARAG